MSTNPIEMLRQQSSNLGAYSDMYLGDHTKGEIEIITDEKRASHLVPDKMKPFGVVYEDSYIKVYKDPVIFPNGSAGSYLRVTASKISLTGNAGSAVIAVLDGKILLINIFRHSLRRRSLEIPRGFSEGDSDIETALREVREETGYNIMGIQYIGSMNPDSGLTSNSVAIYYAELDKDNRIDILDNEGTEEQRFYSKDEINTLIMEGRITDSFTLAAVTLASARGFI